MRTLLTICIASILFTCRSDGSQEIDVSIPENVVAIHEVGREVKIADVKTVSGKVDIADFSPQFIDARGRKYLDLTDDYTTYVYYEFPRIALWRRNNTTGETTSGIIYEISSNQYVFDAITDTNNAYLIVDEFINDNEVNRKLIITNLDDMSNRKEVQITVTNVSPLGAANYLAYDEHKLFVYSSDGSTITLFKVDLLSGKKVDSLSFNEERIVILHNEIIRTFNASTHRYDHFDSNSLRSIGNGNFDSNVILSSPNGFNEYPIQNGVVVADLFFAQPFEVVWAPVEINIEDGNVITRDPAYILPLLESFKDVAGYKAEIISYAVDIETGMLVFGFTGSKSASINEQEGGLIFSNFEGELLDYIELPITPSSVSIIE